MLLVSMKGFRSQREASSSTKRPHGLLKWHTHKKQLHQDNQYEGEPEKQKETTQSHETYNKNIPNCLSLNLRKTQMLTCKISGFHTRGENWLTTAHSERWRQLWNPTNYSPWKCNWWLVLWSFFIPKNSMLRTIGNWIIVSVAIKTMNIYWCNWASIAFEW